jgi:Zn-dependent protease with chaperone function
VDDPAIYFDGQTNRKHSVVLRIADRIDIVEQDTVVAVWPLADVRRADGPPTALLRLACASAPPLARLEVEDEATKQAIVSHCPSLAVGRGDGTQIARIVFWSLAAACSIVGLAVYGVPVVADRLVPVIPQAWENRVGEAVDRKIRVFVDGNACHALDGQAALATLVGKLKSAGGIDNTLDPLVVSSKIENAFALPGGRIFLLDGLLEKARSPDELAGILAHELGHVKHRDGLRKLIQTGGTSFLIGLLFGDVTGAGAALVAARSLLDASYSRDAERDADAFATQTLRKLGRSAAPSGELLLRITGAQSTRASPLLASHPLTEERLEAMKKDQGPVTGEALLSDSEWRALKRICQP